MEYLSLIIFFFIVILFIAEILDVKFAKIKEMRKIAENDELEKLVDTFPSNIEVGKTMLNMLKNEKVEIEEDNLSENSLYIVATNKIIISTKKNTFARLQIIAHECIHSIQSKKVLMTNFIYSNLYRIYLAIISILSIFGIIKNFMLQIEILTILGIIGYFFRGYLEMDAMIRGRFLAKEYLEENNITCKENINKIINCYDSINNIGIKAYNFSILAKTLFSIIFYILLVFIINLF